MVPQAVHTDIQLVRWPNSLSIGLSIMSPRFSAAEVVAVDILNHESVFKDLNMQKGSTSYQGNSYLRRLYHVSTHYTRVNNMGWVTLSVPFVICCRITLQLCS